MSKNGGRRSGVNECKMSNFNIENILKGTSHLTDVVNISEETRHGFQHKYSDDANILAELDSSLGSPGESSCSTDAVQHTVKADLYGTDKDPAYDDEVQGYTHAVPEEAVNADSCPQQTSAGTGTQGEGTEENTGTILIQAQISEENVGASPKGQFNEGIVGASPQFTERIVETNSQAQYIEGNVGTNSQALYIEGNVGTSQTGSADELSQLGEPHPGIPTTVYTDLSHPIVDHNHNELHTSAVHPYTAHSEATYTDPEHPATAHTYPENARAIYTDLDTTSHTYPAHRGATYTDQEHPAAAHAYPVHKGPTYTDQDGNCYQEDGTPFECPPDYPGVQYAPKYQSLQSASCSVGPLADQTQTTQQEQATLYMSPGQQHHQQQQQYPQPNHLQHLHQRTFMSPEAQVRHLLSPGTRHNLSQGQRELIDQLASELVHNYGGHNSHMISDILKATVTHEEVAEHPGATVYNYKGHEETVDPTGTNGYNYNRYERSNAGPQHVPHYSTPQMISDVLGTPSQLPAMEEDLPPEQQLKYGVPQSTSTPDLYRKSGAPTRHRGHNSVTYNDIHVHGGKWTTEEVMYDNEPSMRRLHEPETASESPFPYGSHVESDVQNVRQYYGASPQEGAGYHGGYVEAREFPPPRMQTMPHHNAALMSPTRELQGEVTKTTFTTREHMQMHLNNKMNYQYPSSRTKSAVSDIEYSSIYPPREFIERTACSKSLSSPAGDLHQFTGRGHIPREPNRNNHPLSAEMSHYQEQAYKRYAKFSESSRPPKKRRQSKYSTEDLQVPPQLPLVEETEDKYPTICGREEIQPPKHKYFVVNPSDVTHMAPKALLTKYIDFLINENEQITEISKSVNPPVDVYVKEDMLFMETLRYKHPFPSKKFVEYVNNFYPCLNFTDMKFKGRKPVIPPSEQPRLIPADTRPKQVILDDVFFFFQRERMRVVGTECNLSSSIHE